MTTIFTIILWIASLQGTAAPPAQAGPRAQVRTTVSGTTVRSDASESLSFVTLKLVPLDDPGTPALPGRGGPSFSGNSQAISDAAGQFQFSNVGPGRYAVSAEREGYVRVEQFLPGLRQSAQSILTITAGTKVDGLVVAMTPVPTISGTVYSPLGQRLAGATIQAYRVQYTPYGRQLVRVASVISHEGGEYRLFRLTPGFYYVSASYSGRWLRPWKSLLELSPNLSNPDDGFSTVYYPAEMKVANARLINLNSGGVSNVDINFRETQYFKLSINLRLPPPQEKVAPLANTKVALLPVGSDLGSAQDFLIEGSGTRFSVDRLPEGEYVVVALADLQDAGGKSSSVVVSETLHVRLVEDTEMAIATMYPVDIPGNVSRPAGVASSDGMTVQLVRADPYANQTFSADATSTGQFTLFGVGPGTYDVFLQGIPRNMYLQSARMGRSIQPLLQVRVDSNLPPRTWHCDGDRCTPRLVSDVPLAVSLAIGGNSVSGRVMDERGGGASGAKIVLVPMEPALRQRRDRYGFTYSDASGAFQVQGVRPGSYTAFAFEQIETDIYYDPEFNDQLVGHGTLVNVEGGSSRQLDRPLRLVTRDDVARLTR